MKALNTMMFVSNAAEEITGYKAAIKNADTYDTAKRIGNMALGYINCTITFLNTMICMENNDFTAEFDEVIEAWKKSIYQAVIDKAIETDQDNDTVWRLLKLRDGKED